VLVGIRLREGPHDEELRGFRHSVVVAAGVDASGRGLLVSASRSVIYAGDGEAVRAEALGLAQAINRIRASTGDG